MKTAQQSAVTRDENGIPHFATCTSADTDAAVLAAASKFYGRKMVSVEGRRNIGR